MGGTAQPDGAAEQDLVELLQRSAGGQDALSIALFQFAGFGPIAEKYGEDWITHKIRAKRFARLFIRRRLSKGDLLARLGENLCVAFGERGAEAAGPLAKAIKEELNAFYAQDGATDPPVRVSAMNMQVPLDELLVEARNGNLLSDDNLGGADVSSPALIWRYQPVWDVQREAISNNYLTPVIAETGERVPGYQYDKPLCENFDFAKLDAEALERSEVALNDMFDNGKKSMLGVSLNSASFAKPADRSRLHQVIEGFARDLRKYRVLQVAAIPPGFPRLYLEEVYRGLQRLVPNIALSLSWEEPDVRTALAMQPFAIGISASSWMLSEYSDLSKPEFYKKVRAVVEVARQSGTPFYFDGPVSAQLVGVLRESGVGYVSSPVVWPPEHAPTGVLRWSSDRLPMVA